MDAKESWFFVAHLDVRYDLHGLAVVDVLPQVHEFLVFIRTLALRHGKIKSRRLLESAFQVDASGTAEIDKLISALNKYSDKIDQIRNQKPPEAAPWEKFGQDVKNAIENPLQVAGTAAKGLLRSE